MPVRRLLLLVVLFLAPALPATGQQLDRIWSFDAASVQGGEVRAERGRQALFASQPLVMDGEHAVRVGEAPMTLEGDPVFEWSGHRLTVAAWVRLDRAVAWGGMVSAIEDNGDFERGFLLGTEASGTRFNFGVAGEDNGRLHYLGAPTGWTPESWHHVVGTYDGTRQILYVDGVEVARAEVAQGPVSSAETIRLSVGAYRDWDGRHVMRGALGEVRLHGTTWSATKVAEEARRGRSTYPVVEPWSMQHDTRGWPAYRGNEGRTGATEESLPRDLSLAWSRQLAPPAPAWPAPARGSYWQRLDSIAPRVVDDRAFHPVIAEGSLLLASSADCTLRCLDLATGTPRWRFVTAAPLRYAPAVESGQVVFGGDDGVLRCLSLSGGAVIWEKALGETAPMLPGNGRLVAPHPVRTGVLLRDGRVWATAGLFPSQGVFAVCVSAQDGSERWRQDLGEHSPQGYLLATDRHLIVPGGRSNPRALRLDTGERGPAFSGVGGTYAVICDDELVAGRGNDGSLQRSAANTGAKVVSSRGEHLAVGPRYSFTVSQGELSALDRQRLRGLREELARLDAGAGESGTEAARTRRREALRDEILQCVRWRREVGPVNELIAAGDELLLGLDGSIERRSASKGSGGRLAEVEGRVLALAVAEGTLVATTDRGEVLAFARRGARASAAREAPARDAQDPPPADAAVLVEPLASALADFTGLQDSRRARGFAVVVEPDGLQVVAELLARTEMQVVIAAGPERVPALRERVLDELAGSDLPGAARVSVHALDGGALPFVPYFAGLVLDPGAALERAELERVATPGRGVVLRGEEVWTRAPLEGAGSWTHQFADLGNTASGGDAHTRSDLALQWFGGPGPERMIDRHLRGPPPLSAGGRVFMLGEHRVIGVDAYNGVELWDTELPESQRYSMPFDAGWVACDEHQVLAAVDEAVWVLDAATGDKQGELALPPSLRRGHHWGYLGLDGDVVLGTAMLPSAPRTVPGRELAGTTYRSEVPLVTSRAVFRVDRRTGKAVWTRQEGVIVHPTLAADARRVYFVESRNADCRLDEGGQIALSRLLAADAWLVALDRETGKVDWEQRVDLPRCENVVYVSVSGEHLVLVGSWDRENKDAAYQVRVLDVGTGAVRWESEHDNHRPGQLGHGEQVHHPVILGPTLVAEPFLYDLATGQVQNPGAPIRRPGHSCGTMSGSADCLFFRAGNPTVMDLSHTPDAPGQMTKLSPSRVGCWINILPVQGLVLIPEASASCVCHYALQTSMAFRPR